MDLFSTGEPENILPYDGEVVYLGKILDRHLADQWYGYLFNQMDWKNDEAIVFGKLIVTQRKVAWYADRPFSYTYSGRTKSALPWTPKLVELKKLVEEKSGAQFNSCLMNLYHTGDEGVSWHSDDEKTLKVNATIASFSFGAERKFVFKHKTTKQTVDTFLEHGSLLLMKGSTQTNWLHALPKSKKIISPRISLTFRMMEV